MLHDFMFRVFRWLDFPAEVLHFLEALYFANSCDLLWEGVLYPGFTATRGVRQGCPLSPLLFVIAADLLIRRLYWLIPDIEVGAFADDTAVAVNDFL